MTDYIAIIFARGGSKGIPGKNLLDLNGKPLVAWSIESAKKINKISRIIVSTDSEEIAEVVLKLEQKYHSCVQVSFLWIKFRVGSFGSMQ